MPMVRRSASCPPAAAWNRWTRRSTTDSTRSTSKSWSANLVLAEGRQAVHGGLAKLQAAQRDLVMLLFADPAISYRQISRRLGMPIESIGPTRSYPGAVEAGQLAGSDVCGVFSCCRHGFGD